MAPASQSALAVDFDDRQTPPAESVAPPAPLVVLAPARKGEVVRYDRLGIILVTLALWVGIFALGHAIAKYHPVEFVWAVLKSFSRGFGH